MLTLVYGAFEEEMRVDVPPTEKEFLAGFSPTGRITNCIYYLIDKLSSLAIYLIQYTYATITLYRS